MKKTFLFLSLLAFMCGTIAQTTSSFTDTRDGKVYKTIKIGTQTWMAQNLAYKATVGCWPAYNDISLVSTYGYYYSWEVANMVCPPGWHLPTDQEWMQLINYLGGIDVAGAKLKEAGTKHWESPNPDATNSSGFTALPSGSRGENGKDGAYMPLGFAGTWWTSTQNDFESAWSYNCGFIGDYVSRKYLYKTAGLAVRCVKD